MRVFFLINRYLKKNNFSKINKTLFLVDVLRKKKIERLRKKNFKNFSFINVRLGRLRKKKNPYFSSKKKRLNCMYIKVKKFSRIKFFNYYKRGYKKKNKFNLFFSFLTNNFFIKKDYFFLNKYLKKNYFFYKYYKSVFPLRINKLNNFVLNKNLFNSSEEFILKKRNFYFLNKYIFILQQNELKYLVNNNFYENVGSSDFFYNNLRIHNVSNLVFDLNFSNFNKGGSYLKHLDQLSFFYNNLFLRRLDFEISDLRLFINNIYNVNFLGFFSKISNFFKFKEKKASFIYDNNFIYKYFKKRVKKFYISYYNKLNFFFYNLKKNEILFKKATKKLFSNKYNMLKLYINDMIGMKLNKNLFFGFVFKNQINLNNSFLNLSDVFSKNSFFFNKFYKKKKNIGNFLYNQKNKKYMNYKNFISFGFSVQLLIFKNFLNFFFSSSYKLKDISFLSIMYGDVFYIFNYLKLFSFKQMHEILRLNFIYYNISIKLKIDFMEPFSDLYIEDGYSLFFDKYIPFLYDFLYNVNIITFSTGNRFLYDFLYIYKNFLNNFKFKEHLKNQIFFLNNSFYYILKRFYLIDIRNFLFFFSFFNLLDFNIFKLQITIKSNSFFFVWLNLLFK